MNFVWSLYSATIALAVLHLLLLLQVSEIIFQFTILWEFSTIKHQRSTCRRLAVKILNSTSKQQHTKNESYSKTLGKRLSDFPYSEFILKQLWEVFPHVNRSHVVPVFQQFAYPVWSDFCFNNARRNHQEISDTNISAQVCRQLWEAQNTWTLRICQNMIWERKAKALAQKDNPVSDQQHVQQIKNTSCRFKTKWNNPNSDSFEVYLIWRK